ncbi:hypothetical protein FB45DRAFT_161065 [Roridomyces roridus]|uniref:Uncharacterized protein n=1 Tax=Roridomyces roridus TaxID=1738132 RepID=A0AAD7FEM8_9AGAR|nr:hypothetical protein FB45DRAFT_161065 [Roridomyces roridus]
MSSLVIVDDHSSQIAYTGSWTSGGAQNNYDRTASGSRTPGANMTFTFSGTSASIVGSLDANTSCSASFSLDANSTAFTSLTLPTFVNHQTFWTSAPLPDGPHTLTYSLSSCSSSNVTGSLWLDYILYAPSPNASTDSLVYFLDDTDPRIAYSGSWTAETGSDGDFQSTTHGGQPGSSFQLVFEGISVSVHGRIGNDSVGTPTEASFAIDGGSPGVFSKPYQNSISYNQPLFQSDLLDSGQHTLVVTAKSATAWIDYILVQGDTSPVSTGSTHHSSKLPSGAIAGIGVGALMLALGVALSVIFRHRLFQARFSRRPRRAPPRPSTRPPDINIAASTPTSVSSHRLPCKNKPVRHLTPTDIPPGQSESISESHNSYPPTLASELGIGDYDSHEALHAHSFASSDPFAASPPLSPRQGSYATSSSGGSRVPLIAPPRRTEPSNAGSSSGHTRRIPSLGGDESVGDVKRRQQQPAPAPAPAYDDTLISNGDAQSGTSSVRRPLPAVPPPRTFPPTVDDEAPPVYTYRF